MRFTVVSSIAAGAAATASLAATVSLAATTQAADCTTSLLAALAIPEFLTCQAESGLSLTATAMPADVLLKFCKSDACLKVWSTVQGLGLPECTIDGKQLYKDILDPAETACSKVVSMTNASSSAGEDGSHDDHASHDLAPSNSTSATKASVSSNATASNSSTAAKTPAATNATAAAAKTPTPTASSASTFALTGGVVLLAVSAAFF